MRSFRRVDSRYTHMYRLIANRLCVDLGIAFSLYVISPPGEPAPAREPPARRVEEPEVVAVAYGCDVPEEGALAEEGGLDVVRGWDAAQV